MECMHIVLTLEMSYVLTIGDDVGLLNSRCALPNYSMLPNMQYIIII